MFDVREIGWLTRKPVGLFRFARGGVVWGYTNADRGQVLDGVSYVPAAIKRSSIKAGAERRKSVITVTVPRDLPVVANWRPIMPRDPVTLTILVRHDGDDDAVVDWMGRVVAPRFNGATVDLTCDPGIGRARIAGLSRCWQRNCGLALYSQGPGMCNVERAAHAVPASPLQLDAITLKAPEFATLPTGRLAGGFIEYSRAADGVAEYRTVMGHAGDTITLDYPLTDAPAALVLTAYPGCRQNWDDCSGYFENGDNYGGDPNLPQRNPHNGQPVW
jgi:hypothetical protein